MVLDDVKGTNEHSNFAREYSKMSGLENRGPLAAEREGMEAAKGQTV